MATQEVLEQRLEEIEQAEFDFAMGAREVKITRDNGDEIVFNRTNMAELKRMRQSIERKLGRRTGSVIVF